MRRVRPFVAVLAIGAAIVPAVAVADLGPHSNWYEMHNHKLGVGNDVGITYNRAQHKAYFVVSNSCLGTSSFQGHSYPNTAQSKGIHVSKKGKVNFSGKMTVYTSSASTQLPVTISSTIKSKKATGKITFKAGTCGAIKFTAPRRARTK